MRNKFKSGPDLVIAIETAVKVFALRGGNDNDIYLARYAPNGRAEFLGFAPLDFRPQSGIWYHLRVVILGNRFQIFLNDEKLPRLNTVDNHALWNGGSVFLGAVISN